jgi:glucokinase
MRTAYAIGLDVGGTRIAAGLVDRKGRIVKETKVSTPQGGPFGVVDAIIDAIEDVASGAQPPEVAGIGIGLPAQIDFYRQSVEFCTNLPLGGVDMRGLVMSRVKYSVTLDNDGHMAAIGEARFGAAKGAKDFIMVTVGTGVGGGIFIAGQPFRGHRGLAGEIGHQVIELDGLPCPCGGIGHLEAYVARPAIVREAREIAATYKGAGIKRLAGDDLDAITPEVVIQAANSGDEAAAALMAKIGRILGKSLVGLVNVLNPQLIVIGGGIGEACPILLERASEVIAEEALAGRRDVSVVTALLGNDAGVAGAAALAFDEYESREGFQR